MDLNDDFLSWVQQMLSGHGSADLQPINDSCIIIDTIKDALVCAENKTLHEVSDYSLVVSYHYGFVNNIKMVQ